jgi:phytanoyl-CoA hydroxylase
LTTPLSKQYADQGYAVLENAVPEKEIEAIRRAAEHIVDAFDADRYRTVFSTLDAEQGRDRYFMDSAENVHCFLEADAVDGEGRLLRPKDRAINKIGHALHDRVPAFTHFCRLPVFADTLRAIGYRDPVLWQSMYIFKQPRIGGEVRWHQDASYLRTAPASVVGFWVAIEDASRDNGCLWVQPGGHRSALRECYEVDHATEADSMTTLDDRPWPSGEEAVPVEVAAGSLVIFHDHLPHYSAPNRSDRSRQAFTMHFAEASSDWSDKNWLQRPTLGRFRV